MLLVTSVTYFVKIFKCRSQNIFLQVKFRLHATCQKFGVIDVSIMIQVKTRHDLLGLLSGDLDSNSFECMHEFISLKSAVPVLIHLNEHFSQVLNMLFW